MLPNRWNIRGIGIAAILCQGIDYFNVFPAVDQYLTLLCWTLVGMGFIAVADHQKKNEQQQKKDASQGHPAGWDVPFPSLRK